MADVDIRKIIDSKAALRKELASRPVAEKLRMLDELRRRASTLKRARPVGKTGRTPRD